MLRKPSTGSSWKPLSITYFHSLCYLSDSLTFTSNWFLCLLISILFCLFWTCIWNIQWTWWRWSVYVCISFICYRMIAVPCVRSVGCVFAHIYTPVDNSEYSWTMNFFYYPRLFSLRAFSFNQEILSGEVIFIANEQSCNMACGR